MKTENKMLPRERIMKVLAGEETDRVPFQEIFFGHQAVAEYFGGLQKTPEDAARYLANSGQCSYLVGGFWWTLQSKYLEVEHDVKRYAGGDAQEGNALPPLEPQKTGGDERNGQEEQALAAG